MTEIREYSLIYIITCILQSTSILNQTEDEKQNLIFITMRELIQSLNEEDANFVVQYMENLSESSRKQELTDILKNLGWKDE